MLLKSGFGSGSEFSMKNCTWRILSDQFFIDFEKSDFPGIQFFLIFRVLSGIPRSGSLIVKRSMKKHVQVLIIRFFGWLRGPNSPPTFISICLSHIFSIILKILKCWLLLYLGGVLGVASSRKWVQGQILI